MLNLEMLPAKYGDAIIITYGDPAAPHRILVDAGLGSVAPLVKKRLQELDAHIDLFVVTHVDLDHIGGAVKLLNDKWFTDRVGGVWFNGYAHISEFSDMLGALDGERLTTRILQLGLPWNAGWPWPRQPAADIPGVGGPVVVDDAPIPVELPGDATAIVVSPTPIKLAKLVPEWKKAIEKAGLVKGVKAERDPDEKPRLTMLGKVELKDVAARKTDDDTAPPNGSSISFVFEHDDKRVLLGADAHPDVLIAAFDHLRGADARYRLDACKLPHHGSRANVSRGVVQRLECSQWIVSSNGSKFSHPNEEALARVIIDSSSPVIIHGNYDNSFMQDFASQYAPDENNYTMKLAPAETPGTVLDL